MERPRGSVLVSRSGSIPVSVKANTLVYVENVYAKSLDAIFQQVLETLGYEVTVQRTTNSKRGTTATAGTELEGGVFQVLKAKVKGGLSKHRAEQETEISELLVTSPTESRIIDICEENGYFCITPRKGAVQFFRLLEPL